MGASHELILTSWRSNGFNITIEGEDGEQATIQVDGEEGTVQIDGEDGEETVSIDAQIDEDGEFTVNVEDQDGEVAVIDSDADEGTVEFETEDGEGSLNVEAGLADDWPDEFPLPDDATVVTSLSFDQNGETGYTATFTGPGGSIDRYLEHFRGLATVASETEVTSDEGGFWTIVWGSEDDPIGTLLLSDNGDELGGQIQIGDFN